MQSPYTITTTYGVPIEKHYTAYFDESDTHSSEPNLILAAFVGHDKQWRSFGRRMEILRRRYGFHTFHATDFRSNDGEFAGWPLQKRMQLVHDLATAIRDHLTEGITTTLPYNLFRDVYRAEPIPKKMHLDSQFGLCFRMSLFRLLQIAVTDNKANRLDIVIEKGHPNARDCCRVFAERKAEINELGYDTLGTLRILPKSECWQLMIADFQAHATSLSEARMKVGLPGYFEMASGVPPTGQAALTLVQISADNLRAIKLQWQERKEGRMAKWLAEKERRIAARKTDLPG